MTVVSVVIPYYNRAEWLKLAVDSVLTQTFRDFELIVVDDGSEEDPHLAGVDDPRIRYVRQDHRGVSAARNHGIQLATGKYIAFLDADDLFMPEKLEVQVGQMEARPDIRLSHTSYRRMDALGNDLEEIRSGTFGGSVYPGIVKWCPIATPTVIVRRETLVRQGLEFDEAVMIGEDVILWIDVARRHEIEGIDQALTRVRIHGQNASSDPSAQYLGGIAILRHAFRNDAALGFAFRHRALARVCSSAGHLFLRQRETRNALGCFAKGLAYWPFDRGSLFGMLLVPLPRKVQAELRRRRDAALSGR